MRVYFPDTPDLPLPPGHRFPAHKYRLLKERVIAEGIVAVERLVPSPLASRDQLEIAHDAGYVDAVLAGTLDARIEREIGLPWSEVLVMRSCATVGGTLAAARAALVDGIAGQLAGGTHHARADRGAGFCVFNDVAVTALTLIDEGLVRRVAILDLDVHQGDGTAAILGANPNISTVSVHGEKNFPFRKVASTLDIGLPDGTDDTGYAQALTTALEAVERFSPDLLIYIAGADALAADRLGRLSLTPSGLTARDERVFAFCVEADVPCAFAMGGGYAEPIELTVSAYASTVACAAAAFARVTPRDGGRKRR